MKREWLRTSGVWSNAQPKGEDGWHLVAVGTFESSPTVYYWERTVNDNGRPLFTERFLAEMLAEMIVIGDSD